jgi:hypothetical protein
MAFAATATARAAKVTCAPTPGTVFPVGTTTVTCPNRDDFGDVPHPPSPTAHPPALHLPPTVAADAPGRTGATMAYAATATDTVDGAVTALVHTGAASNGSNAPTSPSWAAWTGRFRRRST